MQTVNGNWQVFLILLTIVIAIVAIVGLMYLLQKKRKLELQLEEHKLALDLQKKMMRRCFEGQENDRKQLSKMLQDDIGMMLMTLRLNLNNQNKSTVNELVQLVDETHDTIRRMTWDLMPTTIENFGLFQSTQELCERLSLPDTPRITFEECGNRISLDKDQELLLYRITQEGIVNAIKHANAANIKVRYQWDSEGLILSISDDGLGFDFPSSNKRITGRHGLGLHNMENRAALLGGKLSFHKNNPTGTVVSLKLADIK